MADSILIEIDPTTAARALGRLGGLASKGKTSKAKTDAGRRNAAKARRVLARKRRDSSKLLKTG